MFKEFTILVPGRQIPRPHVQVDYQKKEEEERKKEIGSVYLRKEGRFVSIPLMSFRLSFRMTHSWKEEPEQQNLDSLDGWAKSNNLNCMRINANPFPEVLQSHLHLPREGGPLRSALLKRGPQGLC